MSRYIPYLFFIVLVALSIVPFFASPVIDTLESFVTGHTVGSYFFFVVLLVFATICMPVSVLPMIPMLSMIFGPFTTGVLSIVGWTLGGCGAFLISRWVGRPFVGRYISLSRLDSMIEKIGPHATFWGIVLIRLSMPVDLTSYALGFVKGIPFWIFASATALGVTWFSFAFAYMGNALLAHNSQTLFFVGLASMLVFSAGWYMLWQKGRSK